MIEKQVTYEIYIDDEWQAGADTLDHAHYYALQYSEDGDVEVYKVTKELVMTIQEEKDDNTSRSIED